MELYKLQLSVTLVRCSTEPKDPGPKRLEDVAREAAEGEGGDPVKRDNQQISGLPTAKMLDAYLDRINHPGTMRVEMPEASVQFRRIYDVQADTLEGAAGLCKKFEAIAEQIGVPSATQLEPQPPIFLPARGF